MADDFYSGIYNPDVLSCLANLSNDEVFTPPEIANQMLDLLPQELFQSPDTKFLDPACKSGVFLREIAKRLLKGLGAADPRPAAAHRPHFSTPAVRHRHHRTDQPAFAAWRVLQQIPQQHLFGDSV